MRVVAHEIAHPVAQQRPGDADLGVGRGSRRTPALRPPPARGPVIASRQGLEGLTRQYAADGGDTAPEGATEAPTTGPATDAAADAAPAPKARKPREGTKQAQLIAMLRTPEGATIDEIVAATSWQPHTVRGAFAGALKKKLGLEVTSDKVEGRGRVYRLEA